MAAMRSVNTKLSAYLANRRAQICEYRDIWKEVYPSTNVHLPLHIPTDENVADLGTRGKAKVEDVSEGSRWHKGPEFLRDEVDTWPTSEKPNAKVPDEKIPAKS